MSASYLVSTSTESVEVFLPGASSKPKSVLWLEPDGGRLASSDLIGIRAACNGYRPAVLSCKSFPRLPPTDNVGSDKRTLYTSDRVISGTLNNPAFGKERRIVAGWVDEFTEEAYFDVVLRKEMYDCSVMAFLPDDLKVLNTWSEIAIGPLWLWLNRTRVANAPEPALRGSDVLLSYIDMVLEIGGLPLIEWQDSDECHGFILFGNPSSIEEIESEILSKRIFDMNPNLVAKLLRRGVSTSLVP